MIDKFNEFKIGSDVYIKALYCNQINSPIKEIQFKGIITQLVPYIEIEYVLNQKKVKYVPNALDTISNVPFQLSIINKNI